MNSVAGMLSASRCLVLPLTSPQDLHLVQTFHQDDRQEIELGAAAVFPKLSSCLLLFQDQGSLAFFSICGESWTRGCEVSLGFSDCLCPLAICQWERRWHTPTIVCFCLTAAGRKSRLLSPRPFYLSQWHGPLPAEVSDPSSQELSRPDSVWLSKYDEIGFLEDGGYGHRQYLLIGLLVFLPSLEPPQPFPIATILVLTT